MSRNFRQSVGVGSMPNLKVIRGQRVLNLGIVFRCGEEACINAKVIRGQRVNAHADSRIFVSGGSILDENFISGQIFNAHADSRIFTSKKGWGAVGGYERAQQKVFWVFIVVFNLFYRRGPQLYISRKSLMFQRSCWGGGGSNINRPYASYRTCNFQGGPDPSPPPPTRARCICLTCIVST